MEGKRGNYYCNSRHQSPSWGGNCLLKNVSGQYILFSLGKMRSQGLIRKQTPNLLCLWHRIKGLLTSHTGKVMLKILQARLQQYANRELPDVQTVLEKAEEPKIKLPTSAGSWKKQKSSRKTSISALLTMPKPLTVWITINCRKFWNRWEYQTTWPASWEICMQVRKQQWELDMEQQTGSKSVKEYVKAV